jgi:mRNA interferase MazF
LLLYERSNICGSSATHPLGAESKRAGVRSSEGRPSFSRPTCEQSGRQPAVVISADPLNASPAGVVIVIPTTTTHRGLPSHVEIGPGGSGLDKIGYTKCEDVKSIPGQRLVARLGAVSDDITFDLARVLRFLLDV